MNSEQQPDSTKAQTPWYVWLLRFLLPILIIAIAMMVRGRIMSADAPPERRAPPRPAPVVEAVFAEPVQHTVKIRSQGTIEARTTGSLQSEVAGKVVSVGNSFRDGGFFIKGETLLQIDDREFRAQLAIAKADIARSQLALNQERARGKQVRNDFKRLGGEISAKKPTTLALRKPQLEAAQADLAAARARLDIAELAIERSRIVAPYNGRIVNKNVDIGQYVTPATMLASVYATDAVEVRLPLADSQLRYLNLPERAGDPQPEVTLTADVAGKPQRWAARLVRTEGNIDSTSRQRVAIAQLIDPFGEMGRSAVPIKIGQFVEAQISGDTLSNVVLLPVTALTGDNDVVFVLGTERKLEKVPVSPLWREGEQLVVAAGQVAGKQVVTVPPTFATDGQKVRLPGDKAAPGRSGGAAQEKPSGPNSAAKPAEQAKATTP